MENKQTKQGQNQLLGLVFILNSILIFVCSYGLTLGRSVTDGTAMLCLIFLAIGVILSFSEDKDSETGRQDES